jgi:hypothetical protein
MATIRRKLGHCFNPVEHEPSSQDALGRSRRVAVPIREGGDAEIVAVRREAGADSGQRPF